MRLHFFFLLQKYMSFVFFNGQSIHDNEHIQLFLTKKKQRRYSLFLLRGNCQYFMRKFFQNFAIIRNFQQKSIWYVRKFWTPSTTKISGKISKFKTLLVAAASNGQEIMYIRQIIFQQWAVQ